MVYCGGLGFLFSLIGVNYCAWWDMKRINFGGGGGQRQKLCSFVRGGDDSRRWVFGRGRFGRGDVEVSVSAEQLARVGRSALAMVEASPKSVLGTKEVAAMRRSAALAEMCLAVALNCAPIAAFWGRGIMFDGAGRQWRVRQGKSGDVFCVYRDRDNGADWNFAGARDVFSAVGDIFGWEVRTKDGFKRALGFVHSVLVSFERICAPLAADAKLGARALVSRQAWLRLASKNCALQMRSRILMGICWLAHSSPDDVAGGAGGAAVEWRRSLAQQGRGDGGQEVALRLALEKICGIDSAAGRLAIRRVVREIPQAVWGALADDFGAGVGKLLEFYGGGTGTAAEFRVLMAVWWQCLTREGEQWRWRGWHRVRGARFMRWRRQRQGVNSRIAAAVNVCGRTAGNTLDILSACGLLRLAGEHMALSIGTVGAKLMDVLRGAAATVGMLGRRAIATAAKRVRKVMAECGEFEAGMAKFWSGRIAEGIGGG